MMSSSDLPKLWTTSSKIAKFVLSKSFFGIKNQLNLSDFFFCEEYLTRISTFINEIFWNFDFWSWKMTLKVQILQSLRRLFIILVGLTMTWFCDKMLISNRYMQTWFDAQFDQKKIKVLQQFIFAPKNISYAWETAIIGQLSYQKMTLLKITD